MKLKISIFLCLSLFACGCSSYHPSSEFRGDGIGLRDAWSYWVDHGRPANFQLNEVLGPPETFFTYTNIVRGTNGVFHCRFGASRPGWPPGVLAVTDDGQLIFACSTNGKVTISPDENGVSP